MNVTNALSSSRGTLNLVQRIGTILTRFGMASKNFKEMLSRYNEFAEQFNCTITLPVTAVILKRHFNSIREFQGRNLEFAIHGYIHTDYKTYSREAQTRDFQKAINTFKMYGIPFTGFRAPYLRYNDAMAGVLSNLHFLYDSSHAVYWSVIDEGEFPHRNAWAEYNKVIDFYQARNTEIYLALPQLVHNNLLVEIPLSLPDDEAIVERLGITDKERISSIWQGVLQKTYTRGELFSLQLHPERIFVCGGAMADTLRQAKGLNPPVWITSLKAIAEWWKEKNSFKIDVSPELNGKYIIKARCSARATIMLKNCHPSEPVSGELMGYGIIDARDFIVKCTRRPVIGISPGASPEAIKFLRSEGYITEITDKAAGYGIYLSGLERFHAAEEKGLVERIESSNAPIIRYWRWPSRSQSALTVTGDIDSVTLFDFGMRLVETRVNSKR